MPRVEVCLTVCGSRAYERAARLAAQSVLVHTDFRVFVAHEPSRPWRGARGARVVSCPIGEGAHAGRRGRAGRFLLKFDALRACLSRTSAELLLLLDADAIFVRPTTGRDVIAALEACEIAMVEQTGIRGSSMTRADFLAHYATHTLAWFDAAGTAPPLDVFRYFNSGVVLGTRTGLRDLADWAADTRDRHADPHEVGVHMIADQDYFQYWAHARRPGCCRAIPWTWNHCEHWDEGFPRAGARVLHFSNFCQGPTWRLRARMGFHLLRSRVRSGTGDEAS